MEREYWVMMLMKNGMPAEYYVTVSEYMPVDNGLFTRVEVFDGPYTHGNTAQEIAAQKNAELDRARMEESGGGLRNF